MARKRKIQITHVKVVINGGIVQDPKATIAGLAGAFNWVYHGGDAGDFEDSKIPPTIAGRCWSYSGDGFVCGCVECTHEELGEALDWIATQWGWM